MGSLVLKENNYMKLKRNCENHVRSLTQERETYKLTFVWQKFCLVCFTKKHLLQEYYTKFFKLIIWIHQLIVFTCQRHSNHQQFFFFSLHNFYLNGSSQQFILCSLSFIYIYYLLICTWLSRRKKFNSWPTSD